MVDDEIELRPILGGLADVADVAITQQMRELLFHGWRKQSFVDAHIDDSWMILAPLHETLVEGIHNFLVIETIGMLGEILVGVVAYGVALPRAS